MNSRKWKADAALVGIAFIWGSTFVLVKSALDDASPLLFMAMRFGLAAAILLGVARLSLSGRARPDRHALAASAVVGACMFGGYMFQTIGLRVTTPSRSAFITAFSVVLVPILLALFFRRFPGWAAALGVSAAIAGLYLFTMPAAGEPVNRGDMLTLACAVSFALHFIFVGYYTRTVPPITLAAGQVLVTFILAAASAPWAERAFVRFTPGLLVAIVVTAALATALAFFVQAWAQQYTSATHAALIISLEPVFAWLASWVALGERLSLRSAVGALLILAGIIIAEMSAGGGAEMSAAGGVQGEAAALGRGSAMKPGAGVGQSL